MLLGLMTGLHEKIAVGDIGLDNKTAADGLAVGRPSGFVGKTLEQLISGSYTISDDTMYRLLALLADTGKNSARAFCTCRHDRTYSISEAWRKFSKMQLTLYGQLVEEWFQKMK